VNPEQPLWPLSDHAKHVIDALSMGALVTTLLGLLPAITALLVLAWTAMRMVETWQRIKINHHQLKGGEK
jgi:hypothetical protein